MKDFCPISKPVLSFFGGVIAHVIYRVSIDKKLLVKAGASARFRQNLDLPYPHPRSDENIMGLAAMRGGQWCAAFAEVLREY